MERINLNNMKAALAGKGLSQSAESAMICFWAKEWANTRFDPISFSRGILKVSVRSASAASELQMREEELLEYLNKRVGKKLIKRLRIMNYQ